MKFSTDRSPRNPRRPLAREVLEAAGPDQHEFSFDPSQDIPAELKAAWLAMLETKETDRRFLEMYNILECLFPELKARTKVYKRLDKLREEFDANRRAKRMDVAIIIAADAKAFGVPIESFVSQDELAEAWLSIQDKAKRGSSPDFYLREAIALLRLGAGRLDDIIFQDREATWKKLMQTDFFSFYDRVTQLAKIKILFPEKAEQLSITSEDINRMKQEILAKGKKATQLWHAAQLAFSLHIITADDVSFGECGEYIVDRRIEKSMPTGSTLPTRSVF